MTLFAHAITGRYGLGHGMLAWARSVVWAHENDAQVIMPNWLQLRIGPYLRRERDKRFYYKLFRAGMQIGGIRRLALLARTKHVRIDQLEPSHLQSSDDLIVEFHNVNANNEARYFHEIVSRSQHVHAALIDMTKPRYLPRAIGQDHIAVHVRGGDFGANVTVEQLKQGAHNMRLPVNWYCEMISALRDRFGTSFPVIIYSDCSDQEIASVLELPFAQRSAYRESITDMLSMAQASVLVSSGSGFSRWGSYLGQVPRLCYPGQRGVRVLEALPKQVELEPEVQDRSELSSQFCEHVRYRLMDNVEMTGARQ